MNPFLSILIFVPLVISLIMCIGFLYLLFKVGAESGIILGLLVTGGLSGYLIYLFKKTFSAEGALFEIPGVSNIPDNKRKNIANLHIFSAYVALILLGLFIFDYELMAGWFGILSVFMGLFLIWSAICIVREKEPISQSVDFHTARATYPQKKTIFYIFAIGLGGIITFSYMYVPSWQFISAWDISGVLFLLACSCLWLVLSEQKRLIDNRNG